MAQQLCLPGRLVSCGWTTKDYPVKLMPNTISLKYFMMLYFFKHTFPKRWWCHIWCLHARAAKFRQMLREYWRNWSDPVINVRISSSVYCYCVENAKPCPDCCEWVAAHAEVVMQCKEKVDNIPAQQMNYSDIACEMDFAFSFLLTSLEVGDECLYSVWTFLLWMYESSLRNYNSKQKKQQVDDRCFVFCFVLFFLKHTVKLQVFQPHTPDDKWLVPRLTPAPSAAAKSAIKKK